MGPACCSGAPARLLTKRRPLALAVPTGLAPTGQSLVAIQRPPVSRTTLVSAEEEEEEEEEGDEGGREATNEPSETAKRP